jgi:hypothetical protein
MTDLLLYECIRALNMKTPSVSKFPPCSGVIFGDGPNFRPYHFGCSRSVPIQNLFWQ